MRTPDSSPRSGRAALAGGVVAVGSQHHGQQGRGCLARRFVFEQFQVILLNLAALGQPLAQWCLRSAQADVAHPPRVGVGTPQASRLRTVPHVAHRGRRQRFAAQAACQAQQGALDQRHAVQRVVKHHTQLECGIVARLGAQVGGGVAACQRLVQPPLPVQVAGCLAFPGVYQGAIRAGRADAHGPCGIQGGSLKACGWQVGVVFRKPHKPPGRVQIAGGRQQIGRAHV